MWLCACVSLSTRRVEGTKETFPLTFDPGLCAANQTLRVFYGGVRGRVEPVAYFCVSLSSLHPSSLPFKPFQLLHKNRGGTFLCWKTQVKNLCFVLLLFFYKIIISLHTEQENLQNINNNIYFKNILCVCVIFSEYIWIFFFFFVLFFIFIEKKVPSPQRERRSQVFRRQEERGMRRGEQMRGVVTKKMRRRRVGA